MPIRFRCAYCNQLLGISRRKAGQVVRCPTCAGQVVVPPPQDGADDDGSPPAPAETSAATSPPVFERSDFDELFNAPAAPGPAAPPPPPAEVFDVEPIGPPPRPVAAARASGPAPPPAGIVLSPARATVLTVAAIVAVALAFGVGLLVGLVLRGTPPPATLPAAPAGQLEGRLGTSCPLPAYT